MAVYAAYRHIELDNIGYGKKRVLKPPGGGSSDIFGAAEPLQNSPRRSRNNLHSSSSVFGPSQSQQQRPPTTNGTNGEAASTAPMRSKPGNDSHARLFGPADLRPASSKDRLKSNIVLSSAEPTGPKDSRPVSPGKQNGEIAPETLSTPRDGNPVTGEGYADENKQVSPTQSTASSAASAGPPTPVVNGGPTHSAPPQRTRVPPGGFSSGLW